MRNDMKELARALSNQAISICQHLLPGGKRSGNYWLAGNVRGERGGSLHLTLTGAKAGQWSDEATGEYGDLIDLIALNRGVSLGEAARYARETYLDGRALPKTTASAARRKDDKSDLAKRQFVARKIWDGARPIADTLAAAYLTNRGIAPQVIAKAEALRFDPQCLYFDGGDKRALPALIAAIRDAHGRLQGIHRIYLAEGGQKADVDAPKRALGRIEQGHISFIADTQKAHLMVCEGVENALSLKTLFGPTNVVSCVSAGHIARFVPPKWATRIAIAADIDRAGVQAGIQLRDRIREGGGQAEFVYPLGKGDWNDALVAKPLDEQRDDLKRQIARGGRCG